jgi:hypothetical protein
MNNECTVKNVMLGGFKGYDVGNLIIPWYIPVSNSVSFGPRIVKCQQNKSSYFVLNGLFTSTGFAV